MDIIRRKKPKMILKRMDKESTLFSLSQKSSRGVFHWCVEKEDKTKNKDNKFLQKIFSGIFKIIIKFFKVILFFIWFPVKVILSVKKVRLKKIIFNPYFRKFSAAIMILAVIVTIYVQNSKYSSGATFTWTQTDWRATPTGANAYHLRSDEGTDQTEFTDYTPLDPDSGIVLSGETAPDSGIFNNVTLSGAPASITQTNDGATNTGFNLTGKAFDHTKLNDTGDNANVKLDYSVITPTPTGGVDFSWYSYGSVVSGNYAYVSHGCNLKILDISNPASPFEVGSPLNISCASIKAISGNYIYVTNDSGHWMKTIDISNPLAPIIVGTPLTITGTLGSTSVSGNQMYMAKGSEGVAIIDITDPIHPSITEPIIAMPSGSSAQSVTISGNYAYVTAYSGGLQIIDLNSNPKQIVQNVSMPGNTIFSMAISGNYAYVNGYQHTTIVNIADPPNASIYSTFNSTGYTSTLSPSYYYIDNGYLIMVSTVSGLGTQQALIVFNINNPTSPVQESIYLPSLSDVRSMALVKVKNNYAYVGIERNEAHDSGFRIIRFADYYSSGTFTSGVIDTGQKTLTWNNIAWNTTQPSADTSIIIRAKTGATNSISGTSSCPIVATINSTNADSSATLPSGNGCITDGDQYIQYSATLATPVDASITPSLDDITIGYNYYPTNQTLISSWYDTNSDANLLSQISWKEDASLPTGTNVRFQIQTAPDSSGSPGTATNFMGPLGTTGSYFSSSDDNCSKVSQTVTCSVPSDILIGTGGDDQWMQYKLYLDSAGLTAPQMEEVNLQYVVNANPVISSVVASENSSGVIEINYNVADDDNSSSTMYFGLDVGATLSGSLTSGATSFTLAENYSNLPSGVQTVQIDQEQFSCTRSGSAMSSCTRAYNGSRAASHSGSPAVWFVGTDANTTGDGSLSNGSGKSGTWNIKADLPEIYYASARVRVIANDGQLANQISLESGATDSLIVDTKDPVLVDPGFTINHTNNLLSIASPSLENSIYTMAVSLSPSPSNFVTFSNTYDITSLTPGSDPLTVYVRIKDEYGNFKDSSTATTPAKPANVVFYDTSNSSSGDYREYIAWSVIDDSPSQVGSGGWGAYRVYRSTDGVSFSQRGGDIEDQNINYYFDTGLESSTHYYYKVLTVDGDGNSSDYSSTVDDIPNGEGGSDSTAPTISGISIENIDTTTATINWSTVDELSTSYVGYSTDYSYGSEVGSISMKDSDQLGHTGHHEIVLTGLTPNTTYNIKIKSADKVGNLTELCYGGDGCVTGGNNNSDFSFSTLPGTAIFNVTAPQIDSNQVIIRWLTTTNSDTQVVYSDTVSSGVLISEEIVPATSSGLVGGSYPYVHSQTISSYDGNPLVSGETYYFYVKSTDASNNIATDNNAGNFYSFVTTEDDDAPVITLPEEPAVIINDTSVAIKWTTDEPATSRVDYGTVSGSLTSNNSVSTYDRSHYVILTGLTADTKYYYKVTSADINTNSTTSSEHNFTTLKSPGYQHDALSEITDVADPPNIITDTKAVISFNTDQPALCTIEYGTASGNYAEVPIVETDYNANHSMHITGLIFSTKYYYQITCGDNLDNIISSDEYYFTTSEKLYTAEGAGTLNDTTAPTISGVGSGTISGESATIEWSTNEKANSLVRYGVTTDYGDMAGNDLVNIDVDNYVTSHSVIIHNLIPATKYYYVVISSDASGNVGVSSENTFSTSSPSNISSIKVVSTALGKATITWNTSKEITSIVEYGLTTSYGEIKQSNTLTKVHSVELSSLNSSVTYHFRVKGKDADNNLYSSADYTFEPKSPPSISGKAMGDITEHSAKVKFNTNVPTSALVTYTDPKNPKNSGSQGVPNLASTHEVELKNLPSGIFFNTKLKVTDEQGNSTEESGPDFTVGKDEVPPKIDQVRTDSALAQNDKVQTIVSWITDEPASTSFIYKEGKNGNEKETKISESLTTNHVAVITILKPGTVYYFKVKSVDQSENIATSSDYALLTPRRKENIIQIIVNNFQDIFGWMKVN